MLGTSGYTGQRSAIPASNTMLTNARVRVRRLDPCCSRRKTSPRGMSFAESDMTAVRAIGKPKRGLRLDQLCRFKRQPNSRIRASVHDRARGRPHRGTRMIRATGMRLGARVVRRLVRRSPLSARIEDARNEDEGGKATDHSKGPGEGVAFHGVIVKVRIGASSANTNSQASLVYESLEVWRAGSGRNPSNEHVPYIRPHIHTSIPES